MPEDGIEIIKEGLDIIIRFGEVAIDESDLPIQVECEQITVHHPVYYGDLVSRIIRERYSDDQMHAIINNHILEAGDPKHDAEFEEMQVYRALSKRTAKAVILRLGM